jgi:hypothetical protein
VIPYTERQRKMFNAKCKNGDREMCKLAKEANALPVKPAKKKK